MRTYFEAYRADHSQILGNLDGQSCRDVKNYRRTKLYRALVSGENRPKWPKVAYWLVTKNDKAVEKIVNIWAQ